MTNCKTIQKRILLYLDGQLTDVASKGVSEHLAKCKACSLMVDRMRNIYSATGIAFPRESDPCFFAKVESRLAKRHAENDLPLFRLRPAMLAAAVVIPLAVGVWLGYATFRHQSIQTLSGELAAEMHQMLTTPGYATLEAYPYGYTE